ncbi:MAG TPA: type VII secretion-associated serine protease mycosin [Jatrophihabitans sp.]
MTVRPRALRTAAVAAVSIAALAAAVTLAGPSAAAPKSPTPGASPTPPLHYVNTTKCVQPGNIAQTLRNGVSWAQTQLNYPAMWSLADSGAGQTVAVIDTGVNREAAFGDRLQPGADLVVAGGDGRDDCDGHGTVVAGLIAASPDAQTGFAGVAPGARLIAIRQSSLDYGLKNAKQNAGQNVAGTTSSLADAIRYAVGRGARIINISEASCRNGNAPADAGTLAVESAVRYAVLRDTVIVAAAGNVDSASDCKTQNVPGENPATIPVPAGLPGVLTVGAVDSVGQPAAFSLAGPWVGVAAPGVDIISTNPLPDSTGQINRFVTTSGVSPVQGTSLAAPYVTGLVALVRARFPALRPPQVIARIERTAEHPSAGGGRDDYVGYGMIDPQAALTAVLPGEAQPSPAPRHGPQTLPAAQPHTDPEHDQRLFALLGTLGLFVAILIGVIITSTSRRRGDRTVGRLPAAAGPRSARGARAAGRGR